MTILGQTKLGSTITGHAELVKLATEQAELDAEIDAILIEDEIVERFMQCATHAMPYFSVSISNKKQPILKFSNKNSYLPLTLPEHHQIDGICGLCLRQVAAHQHLEYVCHFGSSGESNAAAFAEGLR